MIILAVVSWMNDDSMYREMNEGEVNLVCMPIFHVAGTNMGLAGMVTGAKNIIIPEVDPTLILKLIEQEKIQHALFVCRDFISSSTS